jgi:hypothetical protein
MLSPSLSPSSPLLLLFGWKLLFHGTYIFLDNFDTIQRIFWKKFEKLFVKKFLRNFIKKLFWGIICSLIILQYVPFKKKIILQYICVRVMSATLKRQSATPRRKSCVFSVYISLKVIFYYGSEIFT